MSAKPVPRTAGDIICARRKALKLELKDIADATGVMLSYLYAIENGRRKVGKKTAVYLSACLSLAPTEILYPGGLECGYEREIATIRKRTARIIWKKLGIRGAQ